MAKDFLEVQIPFADVSFSVLLTCLQPPADPLAIMGPT